MPSIETSLVKDRIASSLLNDRAVFAFSLLVSAYLIICLNANRADALLATEGQFRQVIGILEISTALIGACYLFTLNRSLLVIVALVWVGVLLHGWSTFFQPSLRANTPVEDYMLAVGVSSNWSFELTRSYSHRILINVLIFSWLFALPNHLKFSAINRILKGFCFGILLNLIVMLIQLHGDIHFLSAGSGTAVQAGRVPGLFEDSGASTVFVGALVSFGIWYLVLGKSSLLLKLIIGVLTFLFAHIAFSSAGRTTVAMILISAILAALVSLAQTIETKKLKLKSVLLKIGIAGAMLGGLFYVFLIFDSPNVTRLRIFLFEFAKAIQADPSQLFNLESLDAYRSYATEVQLDAFARQPLFGTGLGSYFANSANFSAKHGVTTITHMSTNLYFQMLSEFGVLAILPMILVVFPLLAPLSRGIEDRKRSEFSAMRWGLIGAWISIMAAWIAGIHYVFASFSSAVVLLWWMSVDGFVDDFKRNVLKLIAFCFVIGCLATVVFRYATAPNQTAFMWDQTGLPQIPNRFSETIDGRSGIWLREGSEFLLDNPHGFELLVKHPESEFPVKVGISFMDQNGRVIEEQKLTFDQQSWQRILVPDKSEAHCFPPQRGGFCFAKVFVKEWVWLDKQLGVFLAKVQ